MHKERVEALNKHEWRADGRYVLYWMQQAQRAYGNAALEHAIALANDADLPVIVVFALLDDYPEANLRHYRFLLEGLADVEAGLKKRRIGFVLRRGSPVEVVLQLAEEAAALVADVGYTRHQRAWRKEIAQKVPCPVVAIEADVVVPLAVASSRPEIAARTLRPRILRHRETFLEPIDEQEVKIKAPAVGKAGDLDVRDIETCLKALKGLDRGIGPVTRFKGGQSEARRHLAGFVADLDQYRTRRGQPGSHGGSHLSPYLHFGQIAPVEIALEVRNTSAGTADDKSSFLEELIVRRELACNFVAHVSDYDRYACLPAWAKATLSAHAEDKRPALYREAQLEAGETHDPYWNAAMREMTQTGFMHNYMRMYWGKKIIEWSRDPEEAFATALHLNNKWFLDGRDCNSFANVAWCFGLHDRPWVERPIFGKVRYMNDKGLLRKFDMQPYLDWTASLD